MKKLLLSAAFLAATFTAQAQYATSFEANETPAYTVGDLMTQNAWLYVGATAPTTANIVNTGASHGSQALLLSSDPNATALTLVAKDFNTLELPNVIASVDVNLMEANGSDAFVYFYELFENSIYAVSGVRFSYQDGVVAYLTVNQAGNALAWVAAEGVTVEYGEYNNVSTILTEEGEVSVYVNGELLNTQTVFNGEYIDVIGLGTDNGDTDIMFDNINVADALSAQTFVADNFNVYPNPATNVLNINATAELSNARGTLVDVNGRVVKRFELSNMDTQVNISDLNAGVYLLNVSSASGSGSMKVVKQ